jgi:nucleoside-diphosphate-sugar epimerase
MQEQSFDFAIDMICFTADDAQSTLRAFKNVKHLVYCSTVCTYGVDYDWFPVTEDHPLRPITDYGRNKVVADRIFLAAHYRDGFPVTIIKPSTTFGPAWNMLRQVDGQSCPAWIDRVRQGKPIAVCGDGRALHQWLYVDDAAPAFVFALGRERCFGRTYNMMKRECGTWAEYHRAAMRVIGREVDLVGIPLETLRQAGVPGLATCENIFSHNTIYSPAALMRDVPEFNPRITLDDALDRVLATMDRDNRIPDCTAVDWEDKLIEAQRNVGIQDAE